MEYRLSCLIMFVYFLNKIVNLVIGLHYSYCTKINLYFLKFTKKLKPKNVNTPKSTSLSVY